MARPITFVLPDAPPQAYLKAVAWWREAGRYLTSAATLGAISEPASGASPVLDLIDFVVPGEIEAQARSALDRGCVSVAPVVSLDPDLALEARRIIGQRMEWLMALSNPDAPRIDSDIMALREAAIAANDRTFAEAGIHVA